MSQNLAFLLHIVVKAPITLQQTILLNFLFFIENKLTFHVNCLPSRQFPWNVRTYFLWKIKKKDYFLLLLGNTNSLCTPRMHSLHYNVYGYDTLATMHPGPSCSKYCLFNVLVSGQNVNCSSKYSIRFTRIFAEKMWVKSYSHFFSKNISIYAIFNDQSSNDKLTNNIISFEQLGSGE